MSLRIALAGNPNSGKTTLFNALTGSNQFVGNWPGVTVEKKEGKLKKHADVIITDLPGIYSLSPYTLEEIVARNYLITERPDAILNIIDGTNLERNLYLTTQLTELGIPVVVAINMMDVVRKQGDKIRTAELSRKLGCPVVEISALKGNGIMEAAEAAINAAKHGKTIPMHTFSGAVEHALAHIEEAAVHNMPEERQRWYAIKIFERDKKALEQIKIDQATLDHIETDIQAVESAMDDDAESIITNERYLCIGEIIHDCYQKKSAGKLSTSDKIDKVVTNRWAALPIFAIVMFLVYFVSVTTVGTWATDWANDGVFGEGWHLFGIGASPYEEANGEYTAAIQAAEAFAAFDPESDAFDPDAVLAELQAMNPDADAATVDVEDEETLAINTMTAYSRLIPSEADPDTTIEKGYSADAVLIEFGGNDCDYNWLEVSMAPCEAHEPKTPLATFIDTISQMSDMLIKNNIKPVIMNLPPINSQRYFNWISKLKGVNSKNILKWLLHPDAIYRQQERYSLALERIALNKKLHFIDVRSKFLSIRNYIDYLCVDGIHLNANGQQLMGNIFSKYALGV